MSSLHNQPLTMSGVGAADITKLKANGYYTVAVRCLRSHLSNPKMHSSPLMPSVRPRRHAEDLA